MQCLRLLVLFGIHLTIPAFIADAAKLTSSSSSSTQRPFSKSGFHFVEAPHLGRPDATPPPPPPVVPRYQVPEPSVNGFKPILGPRIPIQRRRKPESLDYGTDIITIYDIKPQSKINNDTLIRTVSSSFQVKREDKNDGKREGRVYDDVIYDLPVDTQDFKPQETRILSQTVKHDRLKGWRKIA